MSDQIEKDARDDSSYYGTKELELRREQPENPPETGFRRRSFMSTMAAAAAAATVASCKSKKPEATPTTGAALSAPVPAPAPSIDKSIAPPERDDVPTDILSQCPYCGVGCGTLIQTEKGRIVGMKPDPLHPTNKGLQCIKGLASAEAIYVDRFARSQKKDRANQAF